MNKQPFLDHFNTLPVGMRFVFSSEVDRFLFFTSLGITPVERSACGDTEYYSPTPIKTLKVSADYVHGTAYARVVGFMDGFEVSSTIEFSCRHMATMGPDKAINYVGNSVNLAIESVNSTIENEKRHLG